MHWSYTQTTLHPVIVNYVCPELECKHVVTEIIIALSDDLIHDAHAVKAFHDATIEHLKSRNIKFDRLIKISDGCSSQYKSKLPFFIMTKAFCKEERHFFGSNHGKSRCDGEGAVIKQEISKAVCSSQAVIDNAVQMAAYLKQSEVSDKADSNIHSAKHKARIVKLVNTIERKDLPALIPLKRY